MKQIGDKDIIEDNYIFARINVADIPPNVLKQISEAAYVEGWQDGINRGIDLADDLEDAETRIEAEANARWREHYMQQYADCVNRWAAILNFDSPAHTPMTMEDNQLFHVVYDRYGHCVNYYYDEKEPEEDTNDKEPPIWLQDPDALSAMLDNYDPETKQHIEPTEVEKEERNRWVETNPVLNAMMNGVGDANDD